MEKNKIDEHDMTKKMMDVMRTGYKSLLTEEVKQDDTITPQSGDAVYNDELKKLQDTVDPRVKITSFKIYPNDENVIIEGVFLKREDEDSGIHFKMSLNAGDVDTSMKNIELNDKVSLILTKIKGYYDNWADEWAVKMAQDYRPKNK